MDRRDHADAALHLARAQPLDGGLLLDVELDPVRRPLEKTLAEVKLQRLGLAWKFLLFVLRRPLLQGLQPTIAIGVAVFTFDTRTSRGSINVTSKDLTPNRTKSKFGKTS